MMDKSSVVISLNIESGLLTKSLYKTGKLVAMGGKVVKWEEIELNHIVVHEGNKDTYYECIECVGALAVLREVK